MKRAMTQMLEKKKEKKETDRQTETDKGIKRERGKEIQILTEKGRKR